MPALAGLEVSDMLDVIHVYFEKDLIPEFENHMEIKSETRKTLYRLLYNEEYRYGVKKRNTSQQDALGMDPDMELPDLPPESMETKPYIPVTDIDELEQLLDEPMN